MRGLGFILKIAHVLLLVGVAAAGPISDPRAVAFEGRVFKDEYSRFALSWPFSRASVRFKGSTRVSALLEDSGFDTVRPSSTISFSAGQTKRYKVTREEGLLKLTLEGLDPDVATAAVLTKLSESDDGEVLLYQFEIDNQGR